MKRISSYLFYKLFNYLSGLNYDPEVGNFRIVSRRVVESFCLMREQLRFFGAIMDWMGFSTTSINVKHEERFEGISTYTFHKLLKLAGETIVAYSDKPLRISIQLGFILSGFALLYGFFILFKVLIYGSPISGWSSLIISLYFLGGNIMAVLGILGVYLGKTFNEVKGRPLYLIRNSTISLGKRDSSYISRLSKNLKSYV